MLFHRHLIKTSVYSNTQDASDKSVTMKAALSSNCLGPSPTSLFWVVLNVLVPNVADGMGRLF